MEIQTTLGMLAAAESALGRLVALKLPVKVGYHVSKLAKLVQQETAHYETQRINLIRELGDERDPTPMEAAAGMVDKVHQVRPADLATFKTRLKELQDISVTIQWAPVSVAALEGQLVTPQDLIDLGPLVSD